MCRKLPAVVFDLKCARVSAVAVPEKNVRIVAIFDSFFPVRRGLSVFNALVAARYRVEMNAMEVQLQI